MFIVSTGCDTGFGHLMALNLNETGFTVFAGCLNPNSNDSLSLIQKCAFKDKLIIVPLNVTDETSIRDAHKLIINRINQDNLKLWTLINNAGIARYGEFEWGRLDQEIRSVINVNVIGVCLITRKFLPLIRKSKGRIININSAASRFSPPGMLAYDMSKHATLALTEGLRREMFKFGVRVISIEPFFYDTNIVDADILMDMRNKCWMDTDADIRHDYGEEYFKNFAKINSSFLNRDPQEVVHQVNHAVTAVHPKMTYAVTTYLWRFFQWYMACINHPQEAEEMAWNFGSVIANVHKVLPDDGHELFNVDDGHD